MSYQILLSLISSCAVAKDFGVQGLVYPIAERNPVEVIEEQLDPAGLETLLAQSVDEEKLFASVKGWKPTDKPRRFPYDSTYIVPQDIKDHEGRVLYKKGEQVNPLVLQTMEKVLLFIDGRDETQVQKALSVFPENSKIILVAGSPNTLMKGYERAFYFDQSGHLLKTLGIKQIPAVVTIGGGEVWIEETKLEDENE